VDALIFVGGDIVAPREQRKLKQQLALASKTGTLAVACAGEHAALPTIDIDHHAAAREMTEYLIGLGHQRIGFVGGQHDVSTARQRQAGFRAGMAAAGLQSELLVDSDFTYTGGFDATRRLLAEHAPTAVFAANDQMALGALNAARAAGRHVPTDVTVVGFGDTGAAEHAAPALTTVSMPRHQLGVAAMEALLTALAAKTSSIESRLLPYRIVLRESSAPPRAETQILEERSA
jgi:DNA-binding LacI/PurR family transcriptional regulator